MKYTGDLNKDIFEDYAIIRSNQTIDELEREIDKTFSESVRKELLQKLVKHTNDHYRADTARFTKMSKQKNYENKVRDFHILFGRHWLSSICKEMKLVEFELIPDSFKY